MVYAFFEISYRAYTIAELLEPHVNLFVTILFSHKFQRKKKFPLSGPVHLSSSNEYT